jgi:hypothetical protein
VGRFATAVDGLLSDRTSADGLLNDRMGTGWGPGGGERLADEVLGEDVRGESGQVADALALAHELDG